MTEENPPESIGPVERTPKVLTEADAQADLIGAPRPDNPSDVPPEPVAASYESGLDLSDKDYIEYRLSDILSVTNTLRDKATDQITAKRLTSFREEVEKLRQSYLTSVYPKL